MHLLYSNSILASRCSQNFILLPWDTHHEFRCIYYSIHLSLLSQSLLNFFKSTSRSHLIITASASLVSITAPFSTPMLWDYPNLVKPRFLHKCLTQYQKTNFEEILLHKYSEHRSSLFFSIRYEGVKNNFINAQNCALYDYLTGLLIWQWQLNDELPIQLFTFHSAETTQGPTLFNRR